MRILPVLGSHRRLEREIEQKASAANHSLGVEFERSSGRAKALTVTLSKDHNANSNRVRRLVVELIELHNKGDAYSSLRESCQVIQKSAKRLSLSSALPKDKELVMAISNIIFAANRVSPGALTDLSALFRSRFGQKFFDWTANNGGNLVSERLVKNLGQPIQKTLIDSYLHEISTPRTTLTPAVPGRSLGNKQRVAEQPKPSAPKMKPSTSSQPRQPTGSIISSSASISISNLAPVLPIRIIRPNPRLEIAFDVRTKNPVYSLERLDGNVRSGPLARPAFFEEERLLPEYRSRLCSFICSGYDRGHLAPAADFGPDSVKDTFNLCNISPQNQSMNRSIWAKLEHWCRNVAKKEIVGGSMKCCVYIVTGPVWLPTSRGTASNSGPRLFEFAAIGKGDSLIHVPTHFFKVATVVVDNSRIEKFACFLVPNVERKPNARLEDYIISWGRLEIITGLQFFPHLVDQQWKEEAMKVICTLMKTPGGNGTIVGY